MSDDNIFDVQNVTLRFGGVVSLNDVSLHQRRGEILAVIGPNGAGKTSLFNSLTGVYKPQEGTITFTGEPGNPVSVIGRKPHRLNGAGIARTFQASRMFSALTTFENVKIGAESHRGLGAVGAMLGGPATRRGEKESDRRTIELLDFVGLRDEANTLSASLSYGARRRLEIARGLATNPKVLLLDEPAAGTNPAEKLDLTELIRKVRDEMSRVVELKVEGRTQVVNIIQVFQNIGSEAIQARLQRKLGEFKPACYYGCLLTRPPETLRFDDAEHPTSMETILRGLGAEPVEWNYKTECCGAGMTMADEDTVLELSHKILSNATLHGANCLVVACPMCHVNLDMKQPDVERRYVREPVRG